MERCHCGWEMPLAPLIMVPTDAAISRADMFRLRGRYDCPRCGARHVFAPTPGQEPTLGLASGDPVAGGDN